MISKPVTRTRVRCPKCFSEDLREGEGFAGPNDEDMEVRSFDFTIWQCVNCGWAGEDLRFVPPEGGVAVISPWTETQICL